jgi:hypothetical protein
MDKETCLNGAKHNWQHVGWEYIGDGEPDVSVRWCKYCGAILDEDDVFHTPEYGRGTGW